MTRVYSYLSAALDGTVHAAQERRAVGSNTNLGVQLETHQHDLFKDNAIQQLWSSLTTCTFAGGHFTYHVTRNPPSAALCKALAVVRMYWLARRPHLKTLRMQFAGCMRVATLVGYKRRAESCWSRYTSTAQATAAERRSLIEKLIDFNRPIVQRLTIYP